MGISTHILDTACGRPAEGVPVYLERQEHADWRRLSAEKTDADGRCHQLLPTGLRLDQGLYRIRFETMAYYGAQRVEGLYPYVEIAFIVRDSEQHYHIPLLLTANGFTTYRGS